MEPFSPFPSSPQPGARHLHHRWRQRLCPCPTQATQSRISLHQHHSPAVRNPAREPTLQSNAAATCCCSVKSASAVHGRISLRAKATRAVSSPRRRPPWERDATGFAAAPAARPAPSAKPAGRPSTAPCACATASLAIWTARMASASRTSSASQAQTARYRNSLPSRGCMPVFQASKSSCRAGSSPPFCNVPTRMRRT